MTNEEKEKIVRLIGSGKNSYQDIKTSFPDMDDETLKFISTNPYGYARGLVIHLVDAPSGDKCMSYNLRGNETFELTEAGKNLYYQLSKSDQEDKRLLWTLYLSAASVLVSLFFGVIGLLK